MDSIIIVIIILFLVGTLSYIRPSKKTRQLSKFRLEALKLGFKFATQNLKNSFKRYDANLEIYLIKNTVKELLNLKKEREVLKEKKLI